MRLLIFKKSENSLKNTRFNMYSVFKLTLKSDKGKFPSSRSKKSSEPSELSTKDTRLATMSNHSIAKSFSKPQASCAIWSIISTREFIFIALLVEVEHQLWLLPICVYTLMMTIGITWSIWRNNTWVITYASIHICPSSKRHLKITSTTLLK